MSRGLVVAWLAGVGIVAYREAAKDRRVPPPGTLLGVSALFGGLAVVSDIWPASAPLAAMLGWGLDVAAFLNLYPAITNPSRSANASPAGSTPPPSPGTQLA